MNKGFISAIVDKNKYRVRIPDIHKIRGAFGSVPDANLPIATVCMTPGVIPHYEVGDIVWVGYEFTDTAQPVIMGLLKADTNISNTGTEIKCESFENTGDTVLTADTTIGTVKKENILQLEHIGVTLDTLKSRAIPMTDLNLTDSVSSLKLSWTPLVRVFDDDNNIVESPFSYKVQVGEDYEVRYADVQILDASGNFVRYDNVGEDGLTVENVPSHGRVLYKYR